MPNYQYRCKKCGYVFDEILNLADGEAMLRKACPACGKRALERPICAPAVHMRYSPMHPRHMRGQRRQVTKRGRK